MVESTLNLDVFLAVFPEPPAFVAGFELQFPTLHIEDSLAHVVVCVMQSSTVIPSLPSMMAIKLWNVRRDIICQLRCLPSSARAANKVKYLAWLHCFFALVFSLFVQLMHDALQYVERRQSLDTPSICTGISHYS